MPAGRKPRDYMQPPTPPERPDYMRPPEHLAGANGSAGTNGRASGVNGTPANGHTPAGTSAVRRIGRAAYVAAAPLAENGRSAATSMGAMASSAAAAVTSGAASAAPVARKGVYYGYYLVVIAFIAQFVSVGSQNYAIGPFLTPMTEDLGWTRSEFQLARTVGQFIMAFAGLYIGSFVDRRGGKLLMQIGIVILSASLFATSWVREEWQWLLINGLVVTIGAVMVGNLVVNVTLSKWFVEKRGRMVGFSSMGVSFAGVALTPAATWLVDEVGWEMAWRVLAVAAITIILPISFLMRRAPEDYGLHPDGKSAAEVAAGGGRAAAADFATSMTRQQAMRTPSFYLVVFAYGFGVLSIGVMLSQTIPYMTDAGYSRIFGAAMISLTSVPSMLTKPLWGWASDKVDPRKLSAIGFMLNAIAMTAIVFSVKAQATPLVYASYFLLGCGWGGLIPLQEVVWASFFGRRYLGAVRSAGLPFSLIIGASAPYLTALYFDYIGNYDGIFLGVAGCAVLATFLVMLAKNPRRTRATA